MAMGIAGMMEPALTPPHQLTRPASGTAPPEAIEQLAHAVAAGADSARLAPAFRVFLTDALRQRLGRRLAGARGWQSLGCDNVVGRGITRLDTRVEWICYSKGVGPAPNLLATALHGADWRAAGVDLYSF
jgi:hypothetical protein